jgi:tol-pal system protein YbgF
MHIGSKHLNRLFVAAILAIVLSSAPVPAHAVSKETIELQTQVQQLLDMVQRLQSTLDTRLGVLQHLAEQTADNANQVTTTVNALQQKLNTQNDAISGKLDAASGQVQSLNDSVDELKSRIAKLDKSVQDLQAQLQNVQSPAPGSVPGTNPAATPGTMAMTNPSATSAGQPVGVPEPGAGQTATYPQAASQIPPLKETFQAGVRDYNAAKYGVAGEEFQDIVHYYPLDDISGQAQFYLGEIAYRQQNYTDAVKAYNAVLEGFSGSPKAAAAQLRKGMALLQLGKKDAGIHEFRVLIQRHPQTPEAAQARAKLVSLGVKSTAR